MRILLVNKYYPPHIGGIEFHVRDLAEGLVRAGHEVRVLVCSNDEERTAEFINGVEVIRVSRLFEKASTPVALHFDVDLELMSREADIIHFHFPYPFGEFQWLRTRAHKDKPYVVTYHTDIVRQKVALALYRPFLNRFLDGAAAIIASSPQLIEYSEFLRPRAEKCHQINFGLPTIEIANNEPAQARALELRAEHGGRPIVLFVGRLVYYKGVDVLIESMTRVDADYVVIGSGPLLDEMRAKAVEQKSDDRLSIIDYADNQELVAWLHAADVLALPSVLPSEAFGLVQIEAHAAHTPTVSTLLKSGVPYANLDSVTGFSVEVGSSDALAEGLNKILLDDDLRDRLGAQAQLRATTEFTIDSMVERTVGLYEKVLA